MVTTADVLPACLPPETRFLEGGSLRCIHWKPTGVVHGLVLLAPGAQGGMGPWQNPSGDSRLANPTFLFSSAIPCIYNELAQQLAQAGFAVAHITWRLPPSRAGTPRSVLTSARSLLECAADVATAARFLRVAHELDAQTPTLPLVLVGYCFGAAAASAAAALALTGGKITKAKPTTTALAAGGPKTHIFGATTPASSCSLGGPLVGVVGLSTAFRADDMKSRVGGNAYGGCDSTTCAETLARFAVPLLMMHGLDDTVVDVDHAALFFEAAQGPKSLALLIGAGHTLSARSAAVVPTVLTWVRTLARRHAVTGVLTGQVRPPPEVENGVAFGRVITM